jgi:hypothetical protein
VKNRAELDKLAPGLPIVIFPLDGGRKCGAILFVMPTLPSIISHGRRDLKKIGSGEDSHFPPLALDQLSLEARLGDSPRRQSLR